MNTENGPIDSEVTTAFEASIRGQVLRPREEGYEERRQVWNGMVDRHPAMIVRCAGVADVISSVSFARENDLLLAVKAGGHNVAGNAVCDDGLVIDLSSMGSIRVDPDARIARIEPGVTLGELDHETQAFGLALPAGVVSTTGIAGLTLGGGWGWLSRQYGLTIDHLQSVDVVTANGELIHANETEHADLFWAIRGGGGNFGIVTSFEFDLREVGPMVLAGMIIHPFEDAAEGLRFHRDFTTEAPEELCCYAGIQLAPPAPFLPEEVHGEKVVAFLLCYSGDVDEGEDVVRPLREFGDPIADLVEPMPFEVWQGMLDEQFEPGHRNYWKTQLVDPLPDEAIDIVIKRADSVPAPMLVFEQLGGAISRVAPDATAYRHRDAAFSFNLTPRWTDPEEDELYISWAREFHEALAPYVTESVAVNFLGQEGAERVRAAYGENYDRLVDVKDEYDPGNLFRVNQNIPPPRGTGADDIYRDPETYT